MINVKEHLYQTQEGTLSGKIHQAIQLLRVKDHESLLQGDKPGACIHASSAVRARCVMRRSKYIFLQYIELVLCAWHAAFLIVAVGALDFYKCVPGMFALLVNESLPPQKHIEMQRRRTESVRDSTQGDIV